ncbi:MAG: hypothetical protein IIW52_04320 [Alistipes sp.]|nr:hypothetical protein [Alistipes sp.]
MRKLLLFVIGLLGFTVTACDPEPMDMYGTPVKDFNQEQIKDNSGVDNTTPMAEEEL